MAVQATKQREGQAVELIGNSNASLRNVTQAILDDCVIEANAYFAVQTTRQGVNVNMIIRNDPEFASDFSLKGDVSDHASFVGKLGGQIIDEQNEIETSVSYRVEVTNKTTIYKLTNVDGQEVALGGNPNTSDKVVDAMMQDMAAEFFQQLR